MTPLMYGVCQDFLIDVLELMIDSEHRVLSTVGTVDGCVDGRCMIDNLNIGTYDSWEVGCINADFLDKGVFDMIGMTPLHKAVHKGVNPNILKILLSPNGHNTQDNRMIQVVGNQKCYNGKTPLHLALTSNFYKADAIEMLMDQKRDIVNVCDMNGYTPLHLATKHNHAETIQELTSHNTVSAETLVRRDEAGNNPLMYSMYHHGSLNIMLEGLCGKFKRQLVTSSKTGSAPTSGTGMNVDVDMSRHDLVIGDPPANSAAQSGHNSDAESMQDSDAESMQDSDAESGKDSDAESGKDSDAESGKHDSNDLSIDIFAVETYEKSSKKTGNLPDFALVVAFMIDDDGLVLLELNEARCLPIHEAFLMECPLDVICKTLPPYQFVPLAASPNTRLQTPGMVLGRNDEYERYVAFLHSPGVTPLHQALLDNKGLLVTRLTCRRFKQVLQQLLVAKTSENENALNIAIRLEMCPEIVALLIDKDETVLCTGQVDDPIAGSLVDLPVQVILKRSDKIPFDVMEKYCVPLLGFRNSVLTKQNSKLQTPLHTALQTDVLFERYPQLILKILKEAPPQVYMDVCTMQDSYGNTPLHLATSLLMSPSAWSNHNSETYKAYSSIRQEIMERLSGYGAVLVQNNNGECPLHTAIEAHAEHETLTLALFRPLFLIDRPHNQVLLKPDMHGATPLHLAVRLGCVDIDLLQWLTEKDERVQLIRDETMALPLHTAIEVRQTTPNQLMFLSGTKDAKLWNVRNSRGHIPLCAALYNGAEWGIVRFMLFLIRTDQDRMLALQSVDRHDRTPLQIAMQALVSTESATSGQSATSQCLSALPGRLERGKFVLDGLGRKDKNERTYYSYTTTAWWLSTTRCN